MTLNLHNGDCLEVLAGLLDNSVDSVACDPPYENYFMKSVVHWDQLPTVQMWKEVMRVLKPGGHVLAFGSPRTYHRMACAIEDAGFEIRDCLQWLHRTGFPKGVDISKAIDKRLGAEREIIGYHNDGAGNKPIEGLTGSANSEQRGHISPIRQREGKDSFREVAITAPASEMAKLFDGYGTGLKPSNEPIVLARAPLSESTIVDNVLRWGTGALNINGCKIGDEVQRQKTAKSGTSGVYGEFAEWDGNYKEVTGRWPSNTVISEELAEIFDSLHTGFSKSFYVPKANKAEREHGGGHPTQKPVALMKYLVTLVTPPGGVVLDPFMGSGTTGEAALSLGFSFVGIEREESFYNTARARLER